MQERSMRWMTAGIVLLAILLLTPVAARADVWVLRDWDVNIDGTTYNPPGALPGTVNDSAFNRGTGLGILTITFGTPGPHYAGIYLYQYEDRGFGNNSNSYGTVGSGAPAGVSYQLGDPSVDSVWSNFSVNALDGSNTVPSYVPPPDACCKVAMALMNNFNLAGGETASLSFLIGTTAPGGFYLTNTDWDTGSAVFLSERLSINGGGVPGVPEPAAIWLLLTAGAGTVWARRRARQ